MLFLTELVMPIDYSKWDALDLSDDEEEAEISKAAKKVCASSKASIPEQLPMTVGASRWTRSQRWR